MKAKKMGGRLRRKPMNTAPLSENVLDRVEEI
jgi:hypothetical protein